ncbi:GNAT family N-acetyltransferase [Chloroflexales bacterium ZM16-3]|nr:GNAT family N-acetyltransferase [Chloroflexales bacterium ZM16-3]
MSIRRASTSPADYAAFADLADLAGDEQIDPSQPMSLDDLWAFDRACERSGAHSWRYLASGPSGQTLGIGHFFPVNWLSEPGTYWVVIRVRHDRQRQGIGSALLAQMEADLATLGGRRLWLFVSEGAPGLSDAFQRRGFREQMRSNPYLLNVAAASSHDLAERLDRLRSSHGLRVSTLAECRAEDPDWLGRVYELHAAITREVPIPEKIFTTREEFTAFAVDSPLALFDAFFVVRDGDRYVGLSFMQRTADDPGLLHQELTGTLPEYRGMGLAKIMKLLTIAYAQRKGFRQIVTWVEDTNTSMVAINSGYGFVREPGLILLERPIAGSVAQRLSGSVAQCSSLDRSAHPQPAAV